MTRLFKRLFSRMFGTEKITAVRYQKVKPLIAETNFNLSKRLEGRG